MNLIFLHHSCDGQLFAGPGTDHGTNCLYSSQPNGGGLRALLEQSGYHVHEAGYGWRTGHATHIFDWLPKFRTQMVDVLHCDQQGVRYADARPNQVVMFKSCYPNNGFVSAGTPPENPAGPELSVSNAKAADTALLHEFRKCPNVLFVCVTAPPLAPKSPLQPFWKQLARKVFDRAHTLVRSGPMERNFNHWLSDANGWLEGYPLPQVAVFDSYVILTGDGASDFSVYPTGDGYDSHPNRAFVPFLNQAVRRVCLAD